MKKINRIISDFIILTLSVLILSGCAQSTTQPGGEDINASSSENIDADKYTSKYFRKNYRHYDIIHDDNLKKLLATPLYQNLVDIWNKGEFKDKTEYTVERHFCPPTGAVLPENIDNTVIVYVLSPDGNDLVVYTELDFQDLGKWITSSAVYFNDSGITIDHTIFYPKATDKPLEKELTDEFEAIKRM